jgi:hypothetical protein
VRLWPAFPDPLSAICAKLTTNMSHKQWLGQSGHELLPLHRAARMPRIDRHGVCVGNLFGYPTLVPGRDDPVTQRYQHEVGAGRSIG